MSNPKISVIIPVYNAEATVCRCVDSVLAQTFTDFECILINDGSTDSSGSICDEYAAKDSRVRVFHKENGGVSSARNVGLDNLRGEWVTFVDSDDWILQNALIFCENDEIDIIVAQYKESLTSNDNYNYSGKCNSNGGILKEDKCVFLANNLASGRLKCVCAKYYRTRSIGTIRFDSRIKYGEDTLFFLQIVSGANSVASIDQITYIYNKIDCAAKYHQEVSDSIYAIGEQFKAYSRLGIVNKQFEMGLFLDYKAVCQRSIYRNPEEWYRSQIVSKLYHRIKPYLTTEYKIRYFVQAIPVVFLFRKFLHVFFCQRYEV